jgi:hypothetical protein
LNNKEKLISIFSNRVTDFEPHVPLMDQLNSLEIFSLVSEIEKSFSVHFYPIEINENSFFNIDSLHSAIEKKIVQGSLGTN